MAWDPRLCAECGMPFVWSKQTERFCSVSCAQDNSRRIKRLYRQINRKRIFWRDGYVCQTCGEPTLRQRPGGRYHPLAPEPGHIIGVASGGSFEDSNLACVHACCNRWQHARPMHELALHIHLLKMARRERAIERLRR